MEEVIDHNVTMSGAQAMQWAREISKLPDGCFTIAFYPCSLQRNEASTKIIVKDGCRWRTQLPHERFSVDSDNFFLFTDKDGEPRMCLTRSPVRRSPILRDAGRPGGPSC